MRSGDALNAVVQPAVKNAKLDTYFWEVIALKIGITYLQIVICLQKQGPILVFVVNLAFQVMPWTKLKVHAPNVRFQTVYIV